MVHVMPTNTAGVAHRFLGRRGRSATLINTTGTRDDASDWDDETTTETSHSVTVLLLTPRAAAKSDLTPAEVDMTEVDRYGFLRDDINVDIFDASDPYPSKLVVGGTTYTVLQVAEISGLYRLELSE